MSKLPQKKEIGRLKATGKKGKNQRSGNRKILVPRQRAESIHSLYAWARKQISPKTLAFWANQEEDGLPLKQFLQELQKQIEK